MLPLGDRPDSTLVTLVSPIRSLLSPPLRRKKGAHEPAGVRYAKPIHVPPPPVERPRRTAMAAALPQSYANHRRYVVGFHVVTFGLLLLNLLYWVRAIYRYRTG